MIRAFAPLIDMMSISGLALFIDRVDGTGIWQKIREHWNAATAEPELARTLIDMLEARHQLVGGDADRWGWQQRVTGWIEERGLGSEPPAGIPSPRRPLDPVVSAINSDPGMGRYQMADLFRFEYLAARPGGQDRKPRFGSGILYDRIARARHAQHNNEEQVAE